MQKRGLIGVSWNRWEYARNFVWKTWKSRGKSFFMKSGKRVLILWSFHVVAIFDYYDADDSSCSRRLSTSEDLYFSVRKASPRIRSIASFFLICALSISLARIIIRLSKPNECETPLQFGHLFVSSSSVYNRYSQKTRCILVPPTDTIFHRINRQIRGSNFTLNYRDRCTGRPNCFLQIVFSYMYDENS